MEFRGGRFGGGKLGGIWRGRRAVERRSRRAVLGLGLERLEERVVLSTSNWSGVDAIATGNDNWSDAGNWDVAPTTGSDLVFPTGLTGAALTSNDDISGGSFGSLTIADTGYTIASTQGYGSRALGHDRRVADLGQLDAEPARQLRRDRGDRDGRPDGGGPGDGRRDHRFGRVDQGRLGRARPEGHQ